MSCAGLEFGKSMRQKQSASAIDAPAAVGGPQRWIRGVKIRWLYSADREVSLAVNLILCDAVVRCRCVWRGAMQVRDGMCEGKKAPQRLRAGGP